jgi:ABC transporter substrate binding protein
MASKSRPKAKKRVPTTYEIGFLVAAKTSDWTRYMRWIQDALPAPDFNITFVPPGGAKGVLQTIHDTALYLARSDVKAIVTAGTAAALECKDATAAQPIKIPFVFASVGDPGISGLIPQRGDNFTGGSNQQVSAATSRVDYMLSKNFQDKIAVVGNYNSDVTRKAMDVAHNHLNSRLSTLGRPSALLAPIYPGDDVGSRIRGLADNQGVKSLYVCSDLYLTAQQSTDLNKAAHNKQMQTMFEFEEHCVGHGGDYAYGSDFEVMLKTAADYVKQILLDGKNPWDLAIYETALKEYPAPAKKRPATPKRKK